MKHEVIVPDTQTSIIQTLSQNWQIAAGHVLVTDGGKVEITTTQDTRDTLQLLRAHFGDAAVEQKGKTLVIHTENIRVKTEGMDLAA